MNIILKAFDGVLCKEIVEAALKGLKMDTCISILNDKQQWPTLDAKEHIWLPAKELMREEHSNVDWNAVTPLDEDLMEKMRGCEATFIAMVDRYTKYRDISYHERKRQYLRHFLYFNHLLETKKIDLVLSYTVPHQCYDYVLYSLCKIKQIPFFYIERFVIMDAFLLESDYREAGEALRRELAVVQAENNDPKQEVKLSDKFEEIFRKYTTKNEDPWYMFRREKHLARRSFFLKWGKTALELLFKKPKYLLSSLLSLEFWTRKVSQHNTSKLYDQMAEEPDLKERYIYLPLHLQPEATTCPMAGVFNNQELMAQMLAAHLPPDVKIYIKEHPAQGEICRSKAFYETLANIPSVKLIRRDFSTFVLTAHAVAVATATGTAGLEALFKGKPVIMFGHRFFQYAPGVHRVSTNEDCKKAVQSIVENGETPTLRDMRLFLRAIENCTQPYVGGPTGSHEEHTQEEKAVIMGKTMREKIQPYWR
ncbi:MAG: hypothetical protein PHU04_00810 [Candidatus Peribacteraceae bacterium]|nr:hypothetical protein [Candidatus Peribacteraceae bacterium]